jgi:ribonuclease HI
VARRWKQKGWRNSGKKPVANRDLWEELDAAVSGRPAGVTFQWTRGHAGTELNEVADRLAQAEAENAARKGQSVKSPTTRAA